KGFDHPADFLDRCAGRLIDLAVDLARLREETGRTVRLAIEPEPLCVLETTAETLAFFERLHELAADRNQQAAVSDFLGVCYDVCHQSVEFEDVAASIRSFAAAGVRISKVHITCAIRLEQPLENEAGRRALSEFVEPRYLHQTIARSADGTIHRLTDLTREAALRPQAEFGMAEEWRVHFHVPVNAESLGPLSTTRPDLCRALAAVAALDYAPHLEVETYTWQVLPGEKPPSLVDGLTEELEATRGLLSQMV
ncbi:MAG: metabolite traffic protein EboE, partial [Planctomycetaceae bacterium]